MKGFVLGSVVVFLLVLSIAGPVSAGGKHAPSFQITSFGMSGGNPSLTVQGVAGATIPNAVGDIYAYAFVTAAGIFAVTSHPGIEDSTEVGDDVIWHAHQATLDGTCVTSINDNGVASLSGNTVVVTGTGASSVSAVLTAVLSVNDEGGVCLRHVFSSMSAG
ncbi:MAG: hypothetical protein ACT4OI_09475 [Methanobacteriota archaeon]